MHTIQPDPESLAWRAAHGQRMNLIKQNRLHAKGSTTRVSRHGHHRATNESKCRPSNTPVVRDSAPPKCSGFTTMSWVGLRQLLRRLSVNPTAGDLLQTHHPLTLCFVSGLPVSGSGGAIQCTCVESLTVANCPQKADLRATGSTHP